MPAYRDDITTEHGWFTNTDQVFTFTVYVTGATDEEVAAGTATADNITGYALSWLVKRRPTDTDASALLTKTTGNGGVVLTNPSSGICQASVSDDDTISLTPGTYWHELKRTDAGSERVLCCGNAQLRRSIHRL